MKIRPATPEDCFKVCEVLRRSITELCVDDHGGRDDILSPWLANKTPENVLQWITAPSQLTVIAEIGHDLAGVGQASVEGKILLNYVSPDFRFRGVSKSIMLTLEEGIRSNGCSVVELASTGTALSFYEGLGYVAVGSPQMGHAGRLSYPMEKYLQA